MNDLISLISLFFHNKMSILPKSIINASIVLFCIIDSKITIKIATVIHSSIKINPNQYTLLFKEKKKKKNLQ